MLGFIFLSFLASVATIFSLGTLATFFSEGEGLPYSIVFGIVTLVLWKFTIEYAWGYGFIC
jgi:hypothetical protein